MTARSIAWAGPSASQASPWRDLVRRWTARLRDRTRLYGLVCAIGRWSMIDIFMVTILVALVRFGSVVSIEPGVGAIAFCGVVILTMLSAEGFDPRLMWDFENNVQSLCKPCHSAKTVKEDGGLGRERKQH